MTITSNVRLGTSIGLTIFAWLICTPIFIYWLYRFRSIEDHPVIAKRYTKLVFLLNILAIVYISVERVLLIWLKISDITMDPILRSILQYMFGFLYTICIHGMMYLYLLRTWCVVYDVGWSIGSQRQAWRIHLDPINEQKGNWYIRNKSTFGNIRWVSKILFVIYIVSITLSLALGYTVLSIGVYFIVDVVILLIPMSAIGYLYCKRPVFHDSIGICQELELFCRSAPLCLIAYVIVTVVIPYPKDGFAQNVAYTILGILIPCVLVLQSTVYAIWKTEKLRRFSRLSHIEKRRRSRIVIGARLKKNPTSVGQQSYTSESSTRLASKSKRMSSFKKLGRLFKMESTSYTSTNRTNNDQEKALEMVDEENLTDAYLGLPTVLADWEGFQLFMEHVIHEFSLENLLALVEFTQFQQFYHFDRVNANQALSPNDLFLTLPMEKIPNSIIVYDTNINIQQKCIKLCEKYILPGSDHQLNLSFKTKKVFMDLYEEQFASQTVSQCASIFDRVIEEISSVVLDSFWRFEETHVFQEWASQKFY